MTNLLTMFTGIPADEKIDPKDRSDRAVALSIYRAYNEMGDRARDVDLSKVDLDNGEGLVYSVKVKGDVAIITNRFTQEVRECQVPLFGKFYVDLGWSDRAAILRQRGGAFRKPLAALFGRGQEERKAPPSSVCSVESPPTDIPQQTASSGNSSTAAVASVSADKPCEQMPRKDRFVTSSFQNQIF